MKNPSTTPSGEKRGRKWSRQGDGEVGWIVERGWREKKNGRGRQVGRVTPRLARLYRFDVSNLLATPDPTIFTGNPLFQHQRKSTLVSPATLYFSTCCSERPCVKKGLRHSKKQTRNFLVDTSWLARRRGFLDRQLDLEAEQKAKWWALIH